MGCQLLTRSFDGCLNESEKAPVNWLDKRIFADMVERDMKSLLTSCNRKGGKKMMRELWNANKVAWDESFVRALLRFMDMMGCEDLMVEVCTEVLEECERSVRDRMVRWVSRRGRGGKEVVSVSERMRRPATAKDKFRIEMLQRLASLEVKRGKYEAAQMAFKDLYKLLKCLKNAPFKDVDRALYGLVEMSMRLGEFERAEDFLDSLVMLRSDELGVEHSETLKSMHRMSLVCVRLEKLEEAEMWMKKVVEIKEKHLGWGDASVMDSMQNLAVIFLSRDNIEEAVEIYRIILEIQTVTLGIAHQNTIATRMKLEDAEAINPNSTES